MTARIARIIKKKVGKDVTLPTVDPTEIPDYAEWYHLAYTDLHTCRNYEDGPIPWLAVNEWCKSHAVRGDRAFDMWNVLREVDFAVSSHLRKKREAQNRKNNRRGKRSRVQ